MTEGMANSIMFCKYWLGFGECIQQDVMLEEELGDDLDMDMEESNVE